MEAPLPSPIDPAAAAELRLLPFRRGLFAILVMATTTILLLVMTRLLGGDGLSVLDAALLACFAAMLPWNVIGFWNALIGLVILCSGRDASGIVFPASRSPALGPTRARIALVMPVCNESPERVIRHLAQTVRSLQATNAAHQFEAFLLSDTGDSAIFAAEARAFGHWQRQAGVRIPLHHRRSVDNQAHKTGNLWQFLESHGSRFDHMLVLDADSVMSGGAILRLVRIMEAHPEIGILQQLIVGLPNRSPFPRIFQFGMRHGMRAYTVGSAWWQGDCGPYWGHNAIVRIAPFMAHCRLPVLPGPPPLGGRVLSHDQVEAVLMRAAGWQVRVLPEEAGSFEENPPTLADFVKRDLRWCQGNWQYLHLLARPNVHPMGRLQLLLAVLMYVSGPAWVLFSLIGFSRAVAGAATPAVGGAAAVPVLGAPAAWEPWAMLAATMLIVFAPKLAGVAQVLVLPRLRRAYGGGLRVTASTLVELLFSFALAPIMAVAQSLFVLGMAAGRTIRWDAQRRDTRALPWREAVRGLWPQTALGVSLIAAVWSAAPEGARLWAVLFGGPLLLSIPFAVVTSWEGVGRLLARLGICAVPEEVEPPPLVVAAGHAIGRAPPPATAMGGRAFTPLDAPAAPPVD